MNNFDKNAKYIYGKNPVREELKIVDAGFLFLKKNITPSTIKDILKKADSKGIKINYLDNDFFEKQFSGKSHQGIVLQIEKEYINKISENDFLSSIENNNEKSVMLILDGINDVGNLGAVLRSALLFNVDAVVLPKNNSAPITDVVVKRSAGAVFQVKIIYASNINRFIDRLKNIGYWIYAADKTGESIDKVKFDKKSVIIFGGESKGIRPLIKDNSDFVVTIPTNNKLDSLNLSVSVGIILYEANKN